MRLFRAVSLGEYAILKRGRFTSGQNSMEGKWFAESLEHARQWGLSMTYDPSFIIVEIEVSTKTADQMFRLKMLDGIGPARYAELKQLSDAIIIGFQNVE